MTRFTDNRPAAVDVTIRHTLAPSHPLRNAGDLEGWQVRQEGDKRRKYDRECARLGWTFIPFVMDCYGAPGAEARGFVTACTRLIAGQQEAERSREVEADVWQGLSFTLARELASQFRAGRLATSVEDELAHAEGRDEGLPPWLRAACC